MKLSKIISELQHIFESRGDIEGQIQNDPAPGEPVISSETIYIVVETYEDGDRVNLRSWPY